MGRLPCCDKLGLKKGPWTPEEDQKLLAYVEQHGHGNWRALPINADLQRCGKSCRLRWTNYLRPDIKRGKFTFQEEQTIIQLHALLGNRWSSIATHLPKRTDNEIKNYWNTHLKKRLTKMGIDPVTHKPKNDAILTTVDGGPRTKNAANLSHMAQWESARLEAEARLARQSKLRSNSSVPKAWHIVWPNDKGIGIGVRPQGIMVGPEIESPTSTLSFSENGPPVHEIGTGAAVIKSRGHNGNYINDISDHEDQGEVNEEGEREWKTSHEFDHGIENSLSCNNTSSCDYYDDNKYYWNSILNLVNFSPSNSPNF